MAANMLLSELLELNRRAFDVGNFEIAYHVLAAALHAAEDDIDSIDAVSELAQAQAEAVDARQDHPMSSERAEQRGTIPLFRSLMKTAEAKRAQARATAAIEHHQPAKPEG